MTGTSNVPGYADVEIILVLKGKHVRPNDNHLCGAGQHFDIAALGFDVLVYLLAHECPTLE